MSQILDAIKGLITPELIALGAEKLGERSDGINKAIGSWIPVILGGLANKTENESAFTRIFDMLQDPKNARFLDDLGGLIGGGNLAHGDPKDIAGRLMSMLFGGKVGSIIENIASHANVDRKSSSSLLGMVGPLIMGYLSKKIAKEGLGAMGLARLLSSQKSSILSTVPGTLAASLGLNAVQNRVEETASGAGAGGGSSIMRWLLPLLLVAGLFYFVNRMGGCSGCSGAMDSTADKISETAGGVADKAGDMANQAGDAMKDAGNKIGDAAGDMADKAGEMADNAGDKIGEAVSGLGEFFSKKMACGVELSIPSNGVESKVIAFIEDDSKSVDKTTWFNFDRIVFETSKANLDMSKSEEQLKNIAEILKCYPKANFKIGGYTDNTGSKAFNMKLSQNRAETVQNALIGMGIDASRLAAEGYGPEHPVASNDTEEGRAQNRRIALRVTAK